MAARKNGVEKKLFWQRGPLRGDGRFEWYFLIVNMAPCIAATRSKLEAELSAPQVIEIMGDTAPNRLNYEFFEVLSPSPDIDWSRVYRMDDRREQCKRLRMLALQRLEDNLDISQKIAEIYRGGYASSMH